MQVEKIINKKLNNETAYDRFNFMKQSQRDNTAIIIEFLYNSARQVVILPDKNQRIYVNDILEIFLSNRKPPEEIWALFSGCQVEEKLKNHWLGKQCGQRTIVRLDFKQLETGSLENFHTSLAVMMSAVFDNFQELRNKDAKSCYLERDWKNFTDGTSHRFELIDALKFLCERIKRLTNNRQTPIVLIDDYDVPLREAEKTDKGIIEEIDFFLEEAFKSEAGSLVHSGVLTGETKIRLNNCNNLIYQNFRTLSAAVDEDRNRSANEAPEFAKFGAISRGPM